MKRIRINGKAQSKFDLCYIMGLWHSIPWTKFCDAYTYAFVVEWFKEYAAEKGIAYQEP